MSDSPDNKKENVSDAKSDKSSSVVTTEKVDKPKKPKEVIDFNGIDEETGKPIPSQHGNAVTIDWQKLTLYLSLKADLKTCSYMLGVSKRTIERRIKENYAMTFSEYRESCMSPVKVSLVNKALDMATKGDRTMLIFCLKNYCNFSDDENAKNIQNFIQLNYKLD